MTKHYNGNSRKEQGMIRKQKERREELNVKVDDDDDDDGGGEKRRMSFISAGSLCLFYIF